MRKLLLPLFAATLLAGNAVAQTQKVEVLEYCPAPGQFVNVLPEVEEGMTRAQVLKACEEVLSQNGYLVHLGTYGGYITVRFDHPVENKRGSDILIKGNGMYSASDPVYGKNTIGGSIEPGIVYVGVGDDVNTAQWYELAGSEYYTTQCHDFSITYHKPTAEKGDHSMAGSIYDEYIKYECSWTDKDGTPRDSTGYHPKLSAHRQTYWPMWETADKLTFSGGLLPRNAVKYDVDGKDYWVQYRYSEDAYGYVDACPANDLLYSSFDIDWAVDKNGKHVALDHIDFIRVATGVFQYCGLIGETSTEIDKFEDLHLVEGYDDNPYIITPRPNPDDPTGITIPVVKNNCGEDNSYYNLFGQKVGSLVRGQIYIHKGKKTVY